MLYQNLLLAVDIETILYGSLTQKYNSVSKDVREQIKWLCLFFTKDRDSFEECLRENDVIPDKNERNRLKKCLQDRPYSKLILKCYQPTDYYLL